ncbi:MAG: tetratricopeptide repeat protein [Nannocystaceae bacterium]
MSGAPREEHQAPLRRMERELRGSKRFRFLVATFGDARDRDALIEHLEHAHDDSGVTVVIDPRRDPRWLEGELATLAQQAPRIHVTGFEKLDDQRDEWLLRLNYGRESIAASSPTAVVFWMFEEDATALASVAPDLWAWRAGVYEFPPPPVSARLPAVARFAVSDHREKEQRLARLEQYLSTPLAAPTSATAAMHGEVGAILLELFRNEEALEHLERARSIFKSVGDERNAGTLLGLAGRALLQLRRPKQALERLLEGKEILERHRDRRGQAILLGDLARVYSEQGDLDTALQSLEEALQLATETGDTRTAAGIVGQISELHALRGDLERAIAVMERRLDLLAPDEHESMGAKTFRQLGRLEMRRGDHVAALEWLYLALDLFETLGARREQDITEGDIANAYMLRGETERALEICQRLLDHNRARGDERSASHNLWLMGRAWDVDGKPDAASRAMEEAYEITDRIDNAEGIAMIGRDYGRLLLEAGETSRARKVLTRAQAAFHAIGDQTRAAELQTMLDSIPSPAAPTT